MGKGSLVMFPSGPEGLLVCQEGDNVSRWNSGMTRSAGTIIGEEGQITKLSRAQCILKQVNILEETFF